jgi:hypothetical protein
MQLKFERDFFIRPARGSDLGEVVALIAKHHSTEVSAHVHKDFSTFSGDAKTYFRVILNSNGVLIGAILADTQAIMTLSVNPNFLRREVRDEITRQLKSWANDHSGGKLTIPKEVVAGDWKAYFKHHGVSVENGKQGVDLLEFL